MPRVVIVKRPGGTRYGFDLRGIDRWRASPEEAAAFDALDAAYIAADAAYEGARDAWMAEHKEGT